MVRKHPKRCYDLANSVFEYIILELKPDLSFSNRAFFLFWGKMDDFGLVIFDVGLWVKESLKVLKIASRFIKFGINPN